MLGIKPVLGVFAGDIVFFVANCFAHPGSQNDAECLTRGGRSHQNWGF